MRGWLLLLSVYIGVGVDAINGLLEVLLLGASGHAGCVYSTMLLYRNPRSMCC